jgi:hypothetical protein
VWFAADKKFASICVRLANAELPQFASIAIIAGGN